MNNHTNTRSEVIRKMTRGKTAVGIGIGIVLVGIYWLLTETGALTVIYDGARLHEYITRLGMFGPLMVVVLMTGAIVLSPIPSAPIALAAGLAFGHTWGTVYIVVGAELGALIAFTIGRLLGYDVLYKWFGDRLSKGLLGSQNMLTAIVFVGRLLPFVSFDILSYAAGLTSLAFWRFAVATLAGIIPISFLLAHFGGEMASANMQRMTIAVLGLGGFTLIPVAAKWLWARHQKRTVEVQL